ncbi:MAG: ribosome silencing factor [Thermotogota bacterium]
MQWNHVIISNEPDSGGVKLTTEEKQTLRTLFALLDDKEAERILILNMSETNLLTDYFIICTANSTVHMKALIDAVRDFAEENGLSVIYADKQAKGDWVLVDMGDIVVHIFSKEGRKFYALEELWRESDRINLG